jgi:nicotinic acid mononucleotide adenylyltransferase
VKTSRGRTGSFFQAFFQCVSVALLCVALSTAGFCDPVLNATGEISGTFDPFTKAHEKMFRYALTHYPLKRLRIMVNTDGVKHFNAAFYERSDMLKIALADVLDRIEIIPVTQAEKNTIALQPLNSGEGPVYRFIGEDSFFKVPSQDLRLDDPSTHWIVFQRPDETAGIKNPIPPSHQVEYVNDPDLAGVSSSEVRTLISEGKVPDQKILNPGVWKYIQENSLYPNFPANLLPVQQAFHQQAFNGFLADLSVAMPDLDVHSVTPPDFKPQQSPAGRGEDFLRMVIEQKHLEGEAREHFLKVARPLIFNLSNGRTFAKIPTLIPANGMTHRLQSHPPQAPRVRSDSVIRLRKPEYLHESHTLDLEHYAEQRVPKGMQDMVNSKKMEVYIHDGSREEAIAFHRQRGFDQVYKVITGRGNPDKLPVLVRNSASGALAYLWPNVASEDELARVKEQLALAVRAHKIHMVRHEKKAPLFKWNEAGDQLKLGPDDQVIIGFQNRIQNELSKSPDWKMELVATDGVHVALYTHQKTGRRILSPRNVYGDEMKELIDRFYRKGAQRIFLLGTTGSIDPKIAIGDIVIPKVFAEPNGKRIHIQNEISEAIPEAVKAENYHPSIKHGWVQTILRETRPKIRQLQAEGVQTIDIEARYLIEFLKNHSDVRGGVALIISDQPMATNYVNNNATLAKIDTALAKILTPLYTHVWSKPVPSSCIAPRVKKLLSQNP